jgi:hypothetical protein
VKPHLGVWGTAWRSLVAGAGYFLAVVVSGVLTVVLVPTEAASAGTGNLLFWLLSLAC